MNKEEILNILENAMSRRNCTNFIYETAFDGIINDILTIYKSKTAELNAKVYTYEKIIANSNFAPMLKENIKSKKEIK